MQVRMTMRAARATGCIHDGDSYVYRMGVTPLCARGIRSRLDSAPPTGERIMHPPDQRKIIEPEICSSIKPLRVTGHSSCNTGRGNKQRIRCSRIASWTGAFVPTAIDGLAAAGM